MHAPAPAAWLLVALCAGTAAYCLLRMRSAVEEQRRTAGSEALMGLAMAVMALPAAVYDPPRWTWAVYAVVFGAAALRALWSARAGSAHHLHHLVGAVAMVYMAAAMGAAPAGPHAAMGHGGPGGVPLLTGALLVYYAVYVLRTGTRMVPATADGATAPPSAVAVRAGWGDRREVALACRLSMGMGMLAMLLTV
ncbi:DUF5134 domain-containing protein [Streptomyces sp. NPDC007088]|uniref:DUF5134 domain-containing protein n=1 Tax=Streptomyces sp. NPDC007088 TaxID=3364773 RepID=UPI003689E288